MAAPQTTSSGTITTAKADQPVSASNSARTYWAFQNLSRNAVMWLNLGAAANMGAGSIRVDPGKLIDSSTVPELTQAAVHVIGDTVGTEFTFLEVV